MPGGRIPYLPAGISLAGTVTGTYYELINQNLVSFGFLRAPDGAFTTIDSPGSAASGAAVINPAGLVTGGYFGSNGAAHGFLFLPQP